MCVSSGSRAALDQTGAPANDAAPSSACGLDDAVAAPSRADAGRREQMELVVEPRPTYRLQRIDIKSGDAIDHIKYVLHVVERSARLQVRRAPRGERVLTRLAWQIHV